MEKIVIHIESNGVHHVHRIETLKSVSQVLEDIREEFGEWNEKIEKNHVTRLSYGVEYDEWYVYVTETGSN